MSTTDDATGGALQALSDGMADAVERAGRWTVAIHARRRIPSSGVHWRPGVIAAADHTIRREEQITVTLPDGTSVRAELAGRDPSTDVAALRLTSGELPVAESGGEPRVGHMVLALGRPGAAVTASLGVVSAVAGEWRTWSGGRIDARVQLDLAIYDGFSGGPLVDLDGRLLGLNTSGLARGAPLTIPRATVDRVLDQLLSGGRIARGYIGLAMQAVRLPAPLRDKARPAVEQGLIVVGVEPGGPAERAGLLLGDIVTSLDDTPVGDPGDVLAWLGPDRVGREVQVHLLRGGAPITVTLTIGERPRRQGG
jgi:S1-C subfamily serine protease